MNLCAAASKDGSSCSSRTGVCVIAVQHSRTSCSFKHDIKYLVFFFFTLTSFAPNKHKDTCTVTPSCGQCSRPALVLTPPWPTKERPTVAERAFWYTCTGTVRSVCGVLYGYANTNYYYFFCPRTNYSSPCEISIPDKDTSKGKSGCLTVVVDQPCSFNYTWKA